MPSYNPLTSFKLIILFSALSLLFSCQQNTASFTVADATAVKNSVQKLADNTARDITAKGPVAWLDYFEDTPDFLMASDGDIAFKDFHSADTFIRTTLVKQIPKISLKWLNVRVDALSQQIATVAANFHENLTNATGKVTGIDGYFTATARKTSKGWKYRNAHWSIKHTK